MNRTWPPRPTTVTRVVVVDPDNRLALVEWPATPPDLETLRRVRDGLLNL